MVKQIPIGDPGVASYASDEHGQVELWNGKPPTRVSKEKVAASTTLALYSVVGRDQNGDLQMATRGGAAKATGTLTFSGVGSADETVTIGSVTYTLKAAPAAANEIDIGATADETADNLVAAINGGAGEGTAYGTGTDPHPQVVASKGASGVVELQARQAGQAGEVATTETSAVAAFGAATLTGGVGGVQAVGVLAMGVSTGVGETMTADIWRDGDWNPAALVWDDSFTDDEAKEKAFEGAPTPTTIVIRKNPYDPAFS